MSTKELSRRQTPAARVILSPISARSAVISLLLAALLPVAVAQYSERPELVGPGAVAVDSSGRSLKDRRIRAVHTEDVSQVGGTSYLIRKDPYLAYQLGRNLILRDFRDRDGVFSPWVADLAGRNPDAASAKITANNQTSCVSCHNVPYGTPGAGTNFSKDSGRGRNSPHFFGSGPMEMIALQIVADMMRQLDTDRSGWISADEAESSSGSVFVQTSSDGLRLDFGDPRLRRGLRGPPTLNPDENPEEQRLGTPDLNNIFTVWYVDARGKLVDDAREVDGVRTFGYKFTSLFWGWGQGRGRGGMHPTNRAFVWDPYDTHGGLQAYDPTSKNDPDADGVSNPSLAGAPQFPVSFLPPDCGHRVDPMGFSRDDPDNDGHLNEISEGDLDLTEWYMLNVPRPAFAGSEREYREGVDTMRSVGCTQCHVADWQIHPKSDAFAGDRRLFDFDVRWNEQNGRLEGKLVRLHDEVDGQLVPRRGGFLVQGLFTDFMHHDLGPESAEVDFGGSINRFWRTAPLWGLGSSFPFHHDGASLSIEDSIRRHGGEAARSREKFQALPPQQREAVVRMLGKLALYDIESVPADIDGDGAIATNFMVAGKDTGVERFNPEWLFRVPLRIQGQIRNETGAVFTSFAGANVLEAYAEDTPFRRDTDSDGWPDVWDREPNRVGYMDGVQGAPYQRASGSRERPLLDFDRNVSCDRQARR